MDVMADPTAQPVAFPGDAPNLEGYSSSAGGFLPPRTDAPTSNMDMVSRMGPGAGGAADMGPVPPPKQQSTLKKILLGVFDSIALSQGFPTHYDYQRREMMQQQAQQRIDIERMNAETNAGLRAATERLRVLTEQQKTPVPLPPNSPLVKMGFQPGDMISPEQQTEYTKEYLKAKVLGQDAIVVDTVDENGNPVKKVVAKRIGDVYAAPPKTDTSITPYEDFRRGYPDTPDGRAKAARDFEHMKRVEFHVTQQGGKPPSEAERRAFGFYMRMKDATDTLTGVEDAISKLDMAGQVRLKAPNFMQTETGQIFNQARRQFTEARLRKDSGAAIPESEFENDARMFFAQPGDTPAVIERKRVARANEIRKMKMESGRAYDESYDDSAPPPPKPAGDRKRVKYMELPE